ncbi:uncharacterized protein LOC107646670 [Arachis ipaensis]|uniref:uncharacterized protein LOC107646670 n=1 Tax=Arachis ipaensis TaxID=130454 RepID=UPI0007AF5E94|nr:uncharacterized protein LOC107646670 [Arachis ipaensis]
MADTPFDLMSGENHGSHENQELSAGELQNLAHILSQLSSLQPQSAKSSTNLLADPASVYFLHPSENPGVSIVPIVLNAKNYNSWSRAMKLALKSKNKIGFVDGTIVKPDKNDPAYVAWDKYLLLDLKHRYYHGDRYRVAELEEEMYAMKQGNLSITNYFTKLKAIWEDIDSFKPVPQCKECYEKCDCGLGTMRDYRDETYAVRFLRGLNEQYGTVRSQIMLMKPLPDINKFFSLFIQQERQFNGSDLETQNFTALANSIHNFNNNSSSVSRGRGRGTRGGRGGRGGRNSAPKTCSYCHKAGHLVDTCYHKHGFPPHLQRQKWPRETSNGAMANLIIAGIEESSTNNIKQDKEADGQSQFNQSLRDALITFLRQECAQSSQGASVRDVNQSNAGSGGIPLETYALCMSSHIARLLHIRPILVKLPDGTHTTATISGIVGIVHQTSCVETPQQNDAFHPSHVNIDSFHDPRDPTSLTDSHVVSTSPPNNASSNSHSNDNMHHQDLRSSTRSSSNQSCSKRYGLSHMVDYGKLSPAHRAFSLAITTTVEPKTYEQARLIGCKRVFKVKFHPDGSVECHKARLVAQGFRQRIGYDYFDTFSPQHGFIKSPHDHSLFTKHTNLGLTINIVYVDDLILSGDNLFEIEAIKKALDAEFSIKDLGRLKFFLGIEVACSSEGIALYQRKYTLDLLEEYVGKLSQFLDCATDDHYKAALHVLRYIKKSPSKGLFFSSNNDLKLTGYIDSDWATCSDTRRSITGYCFFLGSLLVSWKSKKQTTVACSPSEAEYRAMAQATREGQWLLYLLNDYHVSHPYPINLYCDNQSALYIAANPIFHERTKHIEVDCHIVREKSQAGVLKLLPIKSAHQTANLLTKALSPGVFEPLLFKLGMLDLHAPLEGGYSDDKRINVSTSLNSREDDNNVAELATNSISFNLREDVGDDIKMVSNGSQKQAVTDYG